MRPLFSFLYSSLAHSTGRRVAGLCRSAGLAVALSAVSALSVAAQNKKSTFPPAKISTKITTKDSAKGPAKNSGSHPVFKSDDVVATVEGQPITRRELTYFWLETDPGATQPVGDLVFDRWKADRGAAPAYTLSLSAIYARLYGPTEAKVPPYALKLSNLVTSRLVEIEAKRQGIMVTKAQAQAAGHAMIEEARKKGGVPMTDEQLLDRFHIPRDIFLNDMFLRLRSALLYYKYVGQRNGHPIRTDDWIVVRELFASAKINPQSGTEDERFTAAESRLEGWIKEVKDGKNFADVAAAHNEDDTRNFGGLRSPSLRGTGTKALEQVIFSLKPGEISAPVTGPNGWYAFKVERRGSQISEAERKAAWKTISERQQAHFLAELRRLHAAQIKSLISLPLEDPNATGQ